MPRPQAAAAAPGAAGLTKLTRKQLKATVVTDHMLLVPGVLSVAEAQRFIDVAEAAGFEWQSSRGPAHGEAFRDNHRISFQDEALADALWRATGLAQAFAGLELDGAAAVGLNPNIRFYRYTRGQRFGRHIDDSVELGQGRFTGYTLLIYLSGPLPGGGGAAAGGAAGASQAAAPAGKGGGGGKRGKGGGGSGGAAPVPAQLDTSAVQQLVGGETVFYGPRGRVVARVAPAPGLALLHLHGEDRCLEHEAAEIVAGVKYVLRSDVVFQADPPA
ncbi:hypothetical protein HT031_005770 [Scenedesmus sp. PABB004]|nr:hypothetical protein HT031_005770 [Scenedesmus sp. PABB004]